MSGYELVAVGLVIAVGIAGAILPVLPGLVISWAAVLYWAVADGGGVTRWTVLAVATVLTVVGVAAKYLLSKRSLQARGASGRTVAAAALGGIVGFFVIPVVGIFIGIVLGALLAEYARLGSFAPAWASARSVLLALGVGTLIEITAGVVLGLVWLAGVVVTS